MSHQPDNFFAGTQIVSLVEVRGTNNSLVLSQFKTIEQDLRNSSGIKWKHEMHLLRLLLTGAATLREGHVPVRVESHRDRSLAVKRGEVPWAVGRGRLAQGTPSRFAGTCFDRNQITGTPRIRSGKSLPHQGAAGNGK